MARGLLRQCTYVPGIVLLDIKPNFVISWLSLGLERWLDPHGLTSADSAIFLFEPYFFVKRHVKKITTPASKRCITFDQTGVRQQTGHQIEAHEVVYPMGWHVELSTWNTVAKRRNQDAKVPLQKGRESEATEAVLCLRTKKPFSWHGTYTFILFFLIVYLTAYLV